MGGDDAEQHLAVLHDALLQISVTVDVQLKALKHKGVISQQFGSLGVRNLRDVQEFLVKELKVFVNADWFSFSHTIPADCSEV